MIICKKCCCTCIQGDSVVLCAATVKVLHLDAHQLIVYACMGGALLSDSAQLCHHDNEQLWVWGRRRGVNRVERERMEGVILHRSCFHPSEVHRTTAQYSTGQAPRSVKGFANVANFQENIFSLHKMLYL